jgi:acyl-CoA hydrolase
LINAIGGNLEKTLLGGNLIKTMVNKATVEKYYHGGNIVLTRYYGEVRTNSSTSIMQSFNSATL